MGNAAIVGSIGWYDYSFSDLRLSNVCNAKHYDKGVLMMESGMIPYKLLGFAILIQVTGGRDLIN